MSSAASICCITTSPADVANANKPSRTAAATSAIATVASNGRPDSSPTASGVAIFTTGTFFFTVIPLLVGCLGRLPNPASTARPGEGSPPQFNKLRDNLDLAGWRQTQT